MTKSDFIKLACQLLTADCQPKSISYNAIDHRRGYIRAPSGAARAS